MALDAAYLALLCRQLDRKLAQAKVDKIHMPSRDEAVFTLHTREGTQRLLLCARSGAARLHLLSQDRPNPPAPISFCMLLRKYLSRARIESIAAVPDERVALVEFTSVAETGDIMPLTLSVELMGRYSNLVLVRDGRVVDALKRIDFAQSELRQLLPGVEFTLPPPQEGKLPFAATAPEELANAALQKGGATGSALLAAVSGISPVVCREITAGLDNTPVAQLAGALAGRIEYVRRLAAGNGEELCIAYDGDSPVEFSFVPLAQYEGAKLVHFDDAGELLERYYSEKSGEQQGKTLAYELTKQVGKLITRAEKKRDARLADRDNSERAQEKRLYGELLTANIHIKPEAPDKITLLNYYTGENIAVPLDPRLTVGANAQKYYKEYKKLTTAQKMLSQLLLEDERELEYLHSVLLASGQAATEQEFDAIRQELKQAGYLRNYKPRFDFKRIKPAQPEKYLTPGGFTVMAGRNNRQNELLTHKTAQKTDLWFHVKEYASAHVILFTGGREPQPADIMAAANIAALHSLALRGSQVAVDYTLVRYVKKIAGAKTGMVTYREYSTVFVKPDEAVQSAMRQGK